MQTGEYHGFARQFPDWLRTQAVVWRGPLLISALIHACLFWPKSLSQNDVGAPLGVGQDGLHARLKPASSPTQAIGRVTPNDQVRHATVTQTSSRRAVLPTIEPPGVVVAAAIPSAVMTASSGLDAGAQRSYRVALARLMMAGDLRRSLPDPSITGALEVGVSLTAAGQLRDVAVVRGSGSAVLDAAVVGAIRQAAQLAPIPPALQGRDFVIVLPVEVGAMAIATSAAGR